MRVTREGRRDLRTALLFCCAVVTPFAAANSSFAAGVETPGTSSGKSPVSSSSETPSAASPPPSSAQASSAPERLFDINAYDVVGNTVLDVRTIDEALESYLGPKRTRNDIEAARKSLEQAYAARGYQTVYVVIPKQTVKGGIVRLEAVETRIGTVSVKGERYTSTEQIADALPSLKPGTVPNLKTLNVDLVALNSASPDRQVTPQMKQGAAPATIDVDLDVQDKLAVHGGVEINNKYSRDTHQYRLQANASYDNLWGLNHSLSALYSVAPEDPADGEVYALTYTAPIPDSDVKLSLTVLRSNSNVTTLGTTDVLGRGWSATLNATLGLGTASLFGEGDYFHYLQGSVAYKRFNDMVSVGGASSSAPITYYPISLGYFGSWRDVVDQVSVNASLNFSFRGLGSDQTGFDNSRYLADGNFVYLRGGFSWLRNLPWGFDLYLSGSGQFANGPLISNEQFSLGGDGSVRGYLQSEGLGDKGVQGTFEVRGPNLAAYAHQDWFNDLRLVAFFDGGRGWLNSALPEQQKLYSLRSTGVGATTELFDHLYSSVYGAWPLKASAGSGLSGVSWYGDPRIQFRVWTQF